MIFYKIVEKYVREPQIFLKCPLEKFIFLILLYYLFIKWVGLGVAI
jgi:hypothetical protein